MFIGPLCVQGKSKQILHDWYGDIYIYLQKAKNIVRKRTFIHHFLLCVFTFASVELPHVVLTYAKVQSFCFQWQRGGSPEAVGQIPIRSQGRIQARGHAHEVALGKGRVCGAALARGRAREVSLRNKLRSRRIFDFFKKRSNRASLQ